VEINFKVHANPVAQGRGQIVRCGRFSKIKDPEKSRNWKADLKLLTQQYAQVPVWDGPLCAVILFEVLRPKSISKKKVWREVTPDLDNYVKAVMDALKGVIYKDDARIVCLTTAKVYSDSPGVTVQIRQIEE
jgi:Holliday junction resolvase RusA-like endonuclease